MESENVLRSSQSNLLQPVSGEETGYVELFGGSVQCPSCRGTGRIPRDVEEKLVALIPMTDNRLKPRRTILYVIITVGLCLFVAGLFLFFLTARSVTISNNEAVLLPSSIEFNLKGKGLMKLNVTNKYNISNQNYFGVNIQKVSMTALSGMKMVGTSINSTLVNVPMRSQQLYFIPITMTFQDDQGYYAYFCNRTDATILIPFQATALLSYMGHTEEATAHTYQTVHCSQE